MKKGMMILGMLALVCLAGCGDKTKLNADDYITLGEYKGLSVTRMSTEITDAQIQEQLDSMLEQSATTEKVTDRTDVQENDIVNIDYTGTLDGVAFNGGSAQGFDLQIGSGRFIPGFEDGLIGAEVSETVTLPLTFPEEYPNNPDLAGKAVEFAVKINSISEQIIPELTDDYITEVTQGNYASVDDYKAYMRDSMEERIKQYADSTMYTDLRDQVVANATMKKDIPEEYIQGIKDQMKENIKSYAKAYNMDYASYLSTYLGLDEAGLEEQINLYAPDSAKETLVLQAIANAENITVSEDELNTAIESATQLYGYESADDFKKNVNMDSYKTSLLNDKVDQFLAEQAVVTVE